MEAYPLQWPSGWKRTAKPRDSKFGKWNNRPTTARGRDEVIQELKRLTGDDRLKIIISTNLRVKLDGFPYSGQREPDDTGVAVYFKHNGDDMVIACDSFKTIGENLTGIARTIEALRGIDRWGCSELLHRAFTGFKALPEKIKYPWYEILGLPASATPEQIKTAYRKKAYETHPDHGGTTTLFDEVQKAYEEALSQFANEK